MAKRLIQLRFVTDNNIPDSVGDYLRRRGHRVFRMRHHMPDDSADPVLAEFAMTAGRILVSWDKDFNSQRYRQARFATLSRLALCGDANTFVGALKPNIDLIEFKWRQCQQAGAPRMIVHLQVGQIRFRD